MPGAQIAEKLSPTFDGQNDFLAVAVKPHSVSASDAPQDRGANHLEPGTKLAASVRGRVGLALKPVLEIGDTMRSFRQS